MIEYSSRLLRAFALLYLGRLILCYMPCVLLLAEALKVCGCMVVSFNEVPWMLAD